MCVCVCVCFYVNEAKQSKACADDVYVVCPSLRFVEWSDHLHAAPCTPEFNLLYDRGVRFGLGNPDRTDSILISAPPSVDWTYDYKVQPGSPESVTMKLLSGKPKEWV